MIGRLSQNQKLELILNGLYVYCINLIYLLLSIFPPFFRNLVFRLLLAKLGYGSFIDYQVYFKLPWLIEIGKQVSIGRGSEFYPDFFGKNKIKIGNNVRISPNVYFHASGHDLNDLTFNTHKGGSIVVENGVWIGANSIILPNVTIGQSSVVAAGAVVTKDVPPFTLVAGIPAKVIRNLQDALEVNT